MKVMVYKSIRMLMEAKDESDFHILQEAIVNELLSGRRYGHIAIGKDLGLIQICI